MKPIDVAAFDQAAQFLVDSLPRALWGFYSNCITSGFDRDGAMRLTIAWLTATTRNGGASDETPNP